MKRCKKRHPETGQRCIKAKGHGAHGVAHQTRAKRIPGGGYQARYWGTYDEWDNTIK